MKLESIQQLTHRFYDDPKTNLALVTNVAWKTNEDKTSFCTIVAYDYKNGKNVRFESNPLAPKTKDDLATTCAIGDVVSYEEADNQTQKLKRNFSHDERIMEFKSAYEYFGYAGGKQR